MSAVPKIQSCKQPNFPRFLFEWHEMNGKVYVIELPGRYVDREFVPAERGTARATILAEHCDTHGRFLGFVQTYLRGYRQGLQDEALLAKGEIYLPLGYPQGGPKVEEVSN